ncbi:3beta-hydroxysteroid-dehydrogenase/decarboxylase isoform 2-like [Dorcoceras hygrometricum]|uniref:3beta-hydroxysteroid-dehydrogenase/decarboxylase isoform 2-like n=1 Tax=Dorcoceras hygrometricum TaxID=472368 RepID=A0A2Z7B3J7_9LAMI|nr:3beta-hydroxysteroid-dehydrogenase/decarboxylase isoform 2-like [Dorcoceras hygrometricum]
MGGEEEVWCVVTGGRGFAARHLVLMLIKYNMFSVRVADLAPTIKLDSDEESGVLGEALKSGRAVYVSADLRDKSQVLRACQGSEVVFHMAAPDSSINNHQLHHSVNVQGTKNVIDACVELKIKRLVYTSSPSVVFDGVNGIINGNESIPYPAKHNDSYSSTKAEGEALVIKANGSNGLLTCCIRPSSIFGPGDKLLVPSLVDAARAGKSKFIIGDGNNMYDFTYVENVAHAHICAERALASEQPVSEKAAGQAYFITNMEPIKFWEFMSLLLEGLGYERPKIKIPAAVMMPIANLVELIYKLLAPYGMKVPQLTPSRIRLLSRSRTFDCSKANDNLGYTPIVTLQEGLGRTIESYSHLRADARTKRIGPSKAELLLGSGKVADVLLWRNRKETITVLLILAAIYFNFIATGYTAITAVSKLLLAASVFLFIHGKLPKKILGYEIEKIPDSKFHVSEASSRQFSLSVASRWNTAMSDLKSLCKGNDSTLFFKVMYC